MATITASMVKVLRERTGAGMMDCKRALADTAGDAEQAVDWLRRKGLAAAAKKAGRRASEGLVGTAISADGRSGALVEVNAETDFVARNAVFQDFVRHCAGLALEADGRIEALARAPFPGTDGSVEDKLAELVATIGENLKLRRAGMVRVSRGLVAGYTHAAAAPRLGRIGVLVALESTGDEARLAELGKQLAMQVAATRPEAVSRDDLDPARVDRERKVLAEQARESGRPEAVLARMVEGRLRKFFEEVSLREQVFVIDGETRISEVLERASAELGTAVEVASFLRFSLGEGSDGTEGEAGAGAA